MGVLHSLWGKEVPSTFFVTLREEKTGLVLSDWGVLILLEHVKVILHEDSLPNFWHVDKLLALGDKISARVVTPGKSAFIGGL